MELRQLRHFAAVAAHGNFSRAAKQLHLTQPALSRQVKNLENELGLALLKREANSVSLTPAGQDFYADAVDLLKRLDKAVARIQSQNSAKVLRVGYVPAYTIGLMPDVVKRFQAMHGNVLLELLDLSPRELSMKAAAGQLDVVVLADEYKPFLPTLRWTELRQIARGVVMPKNHPFARLAQVPPKRLKDQPLWVLKRSYCPVYADRVRALLEPYGVTPLVSNTTADSLATLLVAIEAHKGLALFSEAAKNMLPPTLVYRPIYPPLVPAVIVVGQPPGHPSAAAETFVTLLHKAAERKRSGDAHRNARREISFRKNSVRDAVKSACNGTH